MRFSFVSALCACTGGIFVSHLNWRRAVLHSGRKHAPPVQVEKLWLLLRASSLVPFIALCPCWSLQPGCEGRRGRGPRRTPGGGPPMRAASPDSDGPQSSWTPLLRTRTLSDQARGSPARLRGRGGRWSLRSGRRLKVSHHLQSLGGGGASCTAPTLHWFAGRLCLQIDHAQ